MAEMVRITDVSPRDGLQNEPGIIPTQEKVELIELLAQTGVDEIEVTSFVSPKWVPQMADAAQVCVELARGRVRERHGAPTHWTALVPNLKGLELLESANRETVFAEHDAGMEFPEPLISKIALFTAASETFSRKNTNSTIDESLGTFDAILRSDGRSLRTRGYISCAIACPFEGPTPPAAVADLAARLVDLGLTEIDLGDTIGAATQETTEELLEAVQRRIGDGWFARQALTLHLHDTFGRAAECVRTALEFGVRSFDGSVAGLGGCPYASTPGKRAPGNISTELLVRTIEDAGFRTNVRLDKLSVAAAYATKIVAQARQAAGGGA